MTNREPPARITAEEVSNDLNSLEAVAARLREAGRLVEADQLLAWRNLHALRSGRRDQE